MTPAERLQAAAERLEALDKAAPASPWRIEEWEQPGRSPSWFEVLADPSVDEDPISCAETTQAATADLIAALRPLAGPIARQLREHAVMAQNIKLWPNGSQHLSGSCGLYLAPNPDADAGAPDCECFTDALELADAVVVATGGAS